MISRRDILQFAAASLTFMERSRAASPAAGTATPLHSLTTAARPIDERERNARIARLQAAMRQKKIDALLVESGSTLEYFTGIRWRRSERITAALIPAHDSILLVTPAFEEPSVRETLQVHGEVQAWDEADDPVARIAEGLRRRGIASGLIAVEPTVRFFIVEGLRRESKGMSVISGDDLVRACRLVKSPAELALMQTASDVTMEALRRVHAQVDKGMTAADIGTLMDSTTTSLGATPEFSLVLLNEASAYPHGSAKPQEVRDGSVILMDCGCTVHGYQSDISRTWVFGEPTTKQRTVWNTVKNGQEIALRTAAIGIPVGRIDDAVRSFYETQGWGPGYMLPGLPHRTGHGIGLDGHEAPYLVHNDSTSLQVGMCFSDEPGIYIPGEFGIRLEDCWYMTATGPQTFSRLARSLDEPI